MKSVSAIRLAVLLLLALGVFAIVFTGLAERNLWPRLAPGTLHDSDLWIGLAAGLALCALLILERKRSAS